MSDQLSDRARSVIDANRYMAVGTVDEAGHPWVTPVWYLAAHPEVAIAIYDSSVPVGGAQAVYMKGVAEELTGSELERGLEVFDRLSRRDIDRAWGLDDVQEPSLFRLYRATVSEHWVLIPGRDPDRGSGVDRSERVSLESFQSRS